MNNNTLGYARMIFQGQDGSMGYKQGSEYALRFVKPSFFDKFVMGYDFWIEDTGKSGLPCPYSSVVTFLMNWQQI